MKAYLLGAWFVLGVLLADALRPTAVVALGIGGLAVGLLGAAWWIHEGERGEGQLLPCVKPLVAGMVLVGMGALGVADLGMKEALRLRSPLPGLDGRVLEVTGVLATDPQPRGRAWGFNLRSVFVSEIGQVDGRLAVRAFDLVPKAALGDRARMEVKIEALDPDDPFDRALVRSGIAAEAALLTPVEVLGHSGNPLVIASNFFRERMDHAAARALAPNRAALVLGLVIGDDRKLGSQVRDDFRASGMSHLTAVSGANLAMVLAAFGAVLGLVRVSRRTKVALGLIAIVVFAVITRWEPSVLRASVMAAVALAAFLFGRKAESLHTLAVAFFALLLFDPRLLWSIGFQLSFAATAGILLLRAPLVERLGPVPRWLKEPVAIGLAAQVAVFPLIAIHFDKLSVASLPANLAAVALVAPVTVIGFTGGVLSLLGTAPAWPVMKIAGVPAGLLEWIARVFGRSDLSEISLPNFHWLEFMAACLGLLALWMWLTRRGRRARWPALLAIVVALGTMIAPAARSAAPGGLRVTFFDVGQGDAALVESPGGARVLVDGGPDPHLLATTLRRRGIGRIDLVVASHLHADHVVGLAEVMKDVDVGIALHPGIELNLLRHLNVDEPFVPAIDGDRIAIGDLEVEVLAPAIDQIETAAAASAGVSPEGSALNDASIVLAIRWAGECILFTGDLEESGQQALLERHRDKIDCTVAKAPHHGSARLDPEFMEAVDPEWVPVSVGDNDYGHPSAKAVRIFEGVGAKVLRTDELGDVVIEIDRFGVVSGP
ncbi:MAG: ComEC/Rec2 family competence protein [Actinomycetota bacterium]